MSEVEDSEVEIAAEVITQVLYAVKPEKRAAVLAKATRIEEEASKTRDPSGLTLRQPPDFEEFRQTAFMRHYREIMRMKAALVFRFVRSISNNHSPEKAKALLFDSYPLAEYLRNMDWEEVE